MQNPFLPPKPIAWFVLSCSWPDGLAAPTWIHMNVCIFPDFLEFQDWKCVPKRGQWQNKQHLVPTPYSHNEVKLFGWSLYLVFFVCVFLTPLSCFVSLFRFRTNDYWKTKQVMLIVEIAERWRVDAVWAGWGHASENPLLPDSLAATARNIVFIGWVFEEMVVCWVITVTIFILASRTNRLNLLRLYCAVGCFPVPYATYCLCVEAVKCKNMFLFLFYCDYKKAGGGASCGSIVQRRHGDQPLYRMLDDRRISRNWLLIVIICLFCRWYENNQIFYFTVTTLLRVICIWCFFVPGLMFHAFGVCLEGNNCVLHIPVLKRSVTSCVCIWMPSRFHIIGKWNSHSRDIRHSKTWWKTAERFFFFLAASSRCRARFWCVFVACWLFRVLLSLLGFLSFVFPLLRRCRLRCTLLCGIFGVLNDFGGSSSRKEGKVRVRWGESGHDSTARYVVVCYQS